MPPDHVVPALTHAVNSRWYGGIKRFNDVTLIATDTDWTIGNAPPKSAVRRATC